MKKDTPIAMYANSISKELNSSENIPYPSVILMLLRKLDRLRTMKKAAVIGNIRYR